ncbi:MAG: hypothetical protein NZ888_05095 [Candidatus Nitrosocaldus sp.]|nr:hypothetical protein [Candidatus Nitrosocaldus sp.]MDW8000338.1 hypothetical protein [Candidatus Nitrosocaldus sp.]
MNMPRRVAVISKALGGSWISTMNQLNGVQSVEVKLPENIVVVDDIGSRDPAIIRRGTFDDVEVSINGVFEPSRALNGLLRCLLNYSTTTNPDAGVRYRHVYGVYLPESSVRVCQIHVENEGSSISIDQAIVKSIKIGIEGTGIATYSVEAVGRYVTNTPSTINTDTIRPLYRLSGSSNVLKAEISINANHKPVYEINGVSKVIGIGRYEIEASIDHTNNGPFIASRDNTSATLHLNILGDTLGSLNYGLEFSLGNAYAISSLPVKAGNVVVFRSRYVGNLSTFAVNNNISTVE